MTKKTGVALRSIVDDSLRLGESIHLGLSCLSLLIVASYLSTITWDVVFFNNYAATPKLPKFVFVPKPTCIHTTRSCPAISHYQLGYLGQDVDEKNPKIFREIYGNTAPKLVINQLRSQTISDGRSFSWLWWRPTREVLKGRLLHMGRSASSLSMHIKN